MQASHIVLMIFSLADARLWNRDALTTTLPTSFLSPLEFLPRAEEKVTPHTMLKTERIQPLVDTVCAKVANFSPILKGMKLDSVIGTYAGT
jgi:hypothetical protein